MGSKWLPLQELPPIAQAPEEEREGLFIKRLRMCSGVCEPSDADLKKKILLEIMDYITNHRGCFNERTYPECTDFVRRSA